MMPRFTATASLSVGRPYPRVATTPAGKAAVHPQQLLRSVAAERAPADGGVSCRCPCCIITGGVLYCC
jgi:hypothetical protein